MVTFPVAPEVFLADQERIIGRALSGREKEVTVEWLKAISMSYEDGLRQDHPALKDTLAEMDKLIARGEGSPALQTALRAARAWMIEAWRQGAAKGKRPGV